MFCWFPQIFMTKSFYSSELLHAPLTLQTLGFLWGGGHPYITSLVITYWSDRNTESCNPAKRCTLIPIKPSACRQKQEQRTLVLLFVTFGWAAVLFANWNHKSAALSAVFAIRGSSEQAENATAISCQEKKKNQNCDLHKRRRRRFTPATSAWGCFCNLNEKRLTH